MRYRKGSIELNPDYDDEILRRVLRAGFITNEQLARFLELSGHGLPRRSFNWRVQRLAGHGLLQRREIPMIGRATVYSVAALGVAHLMGCGEHYAGPLRPEQVESGNAILHALDLNDIHLGLIETGTLVEWKSETEIRSRNAFTTFGYAKDYDAIVTVGANGHQAEFALEYERTAKSARKYRRIRREIESEILVAHLVYLASNYHLLNFITQFFEGSRKRIHFGLRDDFRQERLGMRVIDCTRTHSARLSDVLQIAAPEGVRL
jgi:hypothetical protein